MNMNAGRKIHIGGFVALTLFLVAASSATQNNGGASPAASDASQATSVPYDSLKWQAIVPELGKDSPEIAILRVDPKTQATQLLIRTPTKMHVPAHWHSANETHTMIKGSFVFEHDGKRSELGPGGFNYMPAKMAHQAWSSQGAVVLITVDGAWDVNWVGDPPGKNDLGQAAPSVSK
jgi:quercetin dioxygenase-like cupin family protein